MCQLRQELVELLLTLTQLTTTSIVDSKQSHYAVNDEQAIVVTDEVLGDFVEKLHLMFGVDSASVCDVVLG